MFDVVAFSKWLTYDARTMHDVDMPISIVTISRRVRAALDFIRAHHTDSALDLGRTAAAVEMSSFHLTRLLKRETGFGFAHHLRAIRVEEAKRLFQSSTLIVKEVAAAVGYANTGTLARCFKEVVGVTPSAYRRQADVPYPLLTFEPMTAAHRAIATASGSRPTEY